MAASICPSCIFFIKISVGCSLIIRLTLGYFFMNVARNIGNSVGITVGIIPSVKSPPIKPLS